MKHWKVVFVVLYGLVEATDCKPSPTGISIAATVLNGDMATPTNSDSTAMGGHTHQTLLHPHQQQVLH
ncbi:hypothetical protein VNO77_42666 [Canavalia gladiata]|uniref:Secreted protein n=1 Tax=Canavalia gladiata TaxID=3824 RepID=A0AAN9JWA3_CANGL